MKFKKNYVYFKGEEDFLYEQIETDFNWLCRFSDMIDSAMNDFYQDAKNYYLNKEFHVFFYSSERVIYAGNDDITDNRNFCYLLKNHNEHYEIFKKLVGIRKKMDNKKMLDPYCDKNLFKNHLVKQYRGYSLKNKEMKTFEISLFVGYLSYIKHLIEESDEFKKILPIKDKNILQKIHIKQENNHLIVYLLNHSVQKKLFKVNFNIEKREDFFTLYLEIKDNILKFLYNLKKNQV